MNILAGLETFLYVISSALFFPVVAGLVLMVLWIIVSFGSFLREYIDRRQGKSPVLARYQKKLETEVSSRGNALDINLERLLQSTELDAIKSLDKVRFAIRVSPALGLMGTLIPMGIALSAMAQGDMPKMAGSMVTAFTTVVVGLACSVMAYLMSMIKEKWLRTDIREMEYLTELMLRNSNAKSKDSKLEVEDDVLEETETV